VLGARLHGARRAARPGGGGLADSPVAAHAGALQRSPVTTLALAKGRASSALGVAFVFVIAASMLAAIALGEPLAALAVPLAATAVYGLYKLPLQVGVFTVLFLVLAFEGLQYPLGPNGSWEVPLFHPIGQVLF